MLDLLLVILENLICTVALVIWFVCSFAIVGAGFKACDWIFDKYNKVKRVE